MPPDHHNQPTRSDIESHLVDMHAALNKKVDDGFHAVAEKLDSITTALMGSMEDGKGGLISIVAAHERIIATICEQETIEKANQHHRFIQKMERERTAFITAFVAAVALILVSGIGSAIWIAVRIGR